MPLHPANLKNCSTYFKLITKNDHNTRDTPQRVAKMYVDEILQGRYNEPPRLTEFDNAQAYDQLIVTGPLEVRSTCAHHLMPIYGHAYVGILPSPEGKIIGLSKYDRIVDISRPGFRSRRKWSGRSGSISWI